MDKKEVIKQLLPGVVVGLVLGYFLTLLVGVNETDPIPNYIGGAVCCGLPTLLNGIIVLMGSAKVLKKDLSFGKAILRILPYVLCALVIGFLVVFGVVENLLGFNTCEIPVITTAIYESILGVVVSTLMAFIAMKRLEKN